MATLPSVGVVVLNHNGSRFLNGCVSCLKGNEYPRLEIVVVDNASTDGSVDRLQEEHPDVTVLRQPANLGFAEGSNVGIRHVLARGHEYVLLLNNDTRVDPGLVLALVSAADSRTIVAPKSYAWEGGAINSHVGEMDWIRGRLRERFFGRPESEDSRQRQEVELADGACLLVPAEAFCGVGLFDTAYFLYYEDWDFAVRARRSGYRIVFEPTATLRHYERGTTGPTDISPISAYYTTRNRLRFMQKHSGRHVSFAAFLVYFCATRTITVLDYLRRGQWHLARWTLRGVADFVRGRTGAAAVTAGGAAATAAPPEPVPGPRN